MIVSRSVKNRWVRNSHAPTRITPLSVWNAVSVPHRTQVYLQILIDGNKVILGYYVPFIFIFSQFF